MWKRKSWRAVSARAPRMTAVLTALVVSVGASSMLFAACGGDDDGDSGGASANVGSGITKPTPLEPFEPSDTEEEKPDLPRTLAFAQNNDREFAQNLSDGLEAAAEDFDLEFVSADAQDDSARNIQQIEQFLTQGIGALTVLPIDPAAQERVMKQALEQGVAVMAGAIPPSTTIANTDQYRVGKSIGDAAAEYINSELGGEANVVILNEDTNEPIRPRFEAIRASLKSVEGAQIVADVQPQATDKDAAFDTMNTILQKNPDVDVVLGADSVVLGALAALEAANKDDPNQFLGGIDGEPEALDKIREGGPYKATVSLAPTMFGYAFGKFAADWLDGKSIPQAIDIRPALLDSPEAIDEYEADAAQDPGAVYQNYVEFYGSVSYETREDYLAYPWAPEPEG